MKRLSLVLATYGRSDDIGRFIAGLEKQTVQDFELLVVDQNPDDRVVPYIVQARSAGFQVQHFRQETPNLSAARNVGIGHARGEIIAFPDDDCWYEPELVQEVLSAFNDRPELGGLVVEWVEQARGRKNGPADQVLSIERWRRFRDGDASSISLFFKADVLRQVGGFDPRLGVGQWFGAGEETDLILSVLARNTLLLRCPAARVHHVYMLHGPPTKGSWKNSLSRARGAGAIYVKHRLSWLILLRGIFGPFINALRPWRGAQAVHLAFATSLGRVQGAIGWLLKENK